MKRSWSYIILALLAGVFTVWWFSPRQVLKRRTVSLMETLTLESGTAMTGRQMAVYSLNGLLAEEVELEAATIEQANGTFGRQEIESAFSWLCQQAKQTRFEVEDFENITVSGDKGEVVCLLDAHVELPAVRVVDGTQRCRLFWRRGDDGWRLERAIWMEGKN